MGKPQVALFSAVLFIGALPWVASSSAETGQETAALPQSATPSPNAASPNTPSPNTPSPDSPPTNPPAVKSYEIQSFYVDSRQFKIGDVVPDVYRTKPYEIAEWNKRNLPAPQENSHWTYMGGNYVLITNDEGKILQAESGDIFFQM
ncbi:RcnB family protein [Sodalis sp. RH21]|uniref:RcnB family protein n=1 Tax=unclassified Sodalis (in: enterobacteria) TaxID=2636512 RepID=UPI0039B4F4A6